jgi:hypothetical protein
MHYCRSQFPSLRKMRWFSCEMTDDGRFDESQTAAGSGPSPQTGTQTASKTESFTCRVEILVLTISRQNTVHISHIIEFSSIFTEINWQPNGQSEEI